MVNSFYKKVRKDDLLAPVFAGIAKFDWDEHLPIMYDFWTTLIIDKKGYRGNPYPKHVVLDISSKHFDQWLIHFNDTIDAKFKGKNADEMKRVASQIAVAFSHKMAAKKNMA